MNGQLGTGGIILGLVASLGGVATMGFGLLRQRPNILVVGRSYAWMTLLGAVVAFGAMERALITRDYTIRYVAENGSSRTPPLYNFAALWSALEGSILLWVLVLTGFIALVAWRFRSRLHDPLVGWAMLTLFAVSLFFFTLLLGPANPFESFDPPAGFDGDGPNPLLQNHWLMAIHPPVLYLGYVGFTVPFAFAVAALATGRLGEGWLLETRRWTLIAWGCLTIGILLGGWWSYAVLGWGGYWAWDPVENASLLPWLTGTAYLHSVMVQERRGMLRVWNLSLLCATFSLTILGTFLTRSGTLDSVHAFTQSSIGPWLLSFFGLTVAVTLGLIAWRGDRLRSPGRIDSPASREGAFLLNNLLFAVFAFFVLLGTVFPLILEALNGDRVTVGRPFFDRYAVPLGLCLLFLMAVAPVLPWRKASTELLSKRLFWPAWAGVGALAFAVAVGARGLAPLLAFGLGGFAAGAALRQVILASRRQGWRGVVGRANGGMIVHLGVVMVAVALAASNSFDTERELTLAPGESAPVGDHTVTFRGMREVDDANKSSTVATVEVDGEVLEPALSRFDGGNQLIGTPAIRTSPVEDVYLALVRTPDGTGPDDQVVLRVILQPMVLWLWLGGLVMALGTLLAAFPGRRRDPLQPVSAPLAVVGSPDAEPGEPVSGEDAEPEAGKVEVGV